MAMIHGKANRIAVKAIEVLSPVCEIVNVAGSLRRLKPVVKDIEIVCLPRHETPIGLFGPTGEVVRAEFFFRAVNSLGRVLKGNSKGRYMQIDLGSINLDLFMPEKYDYYRQLAIRTGSGEYAQHTIAAGWVKLGWAGTPDGLRLKSQCVLTGHGYKCVERYPVLPPVWQSEKEFFDWIKVPYVMPKLRTI